MEQYRVSVLISNSNGIDKSFEESHQGSLKSLMIALKNIKDKTNEYLTGIVNEEKKNKRRELEYVRKANAEDSDEEIEDDFIDSKIKNELLIKRFSPENVYKCNIKTKAYQMFKLKGKF